MRILYLCHRAPYPPDKGDRLRAFHHLRHLSERHDVHLVALADDPSAARRAAPLNEICSEVDLFVRHPAVANLRVLLALVGRRPLTHAAYTSPGFAARLTELAAKTSFDAVVAYCSSMAPFACLFDGLPRLLDLVDVDSAKWSQYARVSGLPMRPIYSLEARRLRAYESELDRHFDSIAVTTRRELDLMRSICPRANLVTVRNGIDLDYFTTLDCRPTTMPSLVFTGQMDYLPNVDAAVDFTRHVFPRLRRELPELRFVIVGRAPAPAVRELESLPGVEVTGEVEDIRPYVSRSWLFVAPLRVARGIQNKVLEAMALGVPVVCSPKVFAGLADGDIDDRRHLRVAHDHDDFVDTTLALLRDKAARDRLAGAARSQLGRSYSWASNCQLLEATLSSLVPTDSSTTAATA